MFRFLEQVHIIQGFHTGEDAIILDFVEGWADGEEPGPNEYLIRFVSLPSYMVWIEEDRLEALKK